MHIKKGDQVIVISGDDKNKRGKVLKVYPKTNRVIIEGVGMIKRHMRPSQQYPNGGIIEKEAPIHASNVMVISPTSNAPTRVSIKVMEGEGKLSRRRVRYSKKYDEILPSGE
ncbi:MAG: 50S ribosomal protein L24 [Deferribacteres bacterium]|nr:50S ribosomal protein L24 [candidate division KSB1 bacterium]MCB9502646.1 50S ribosomal protein L24 [Deferribacteres bacterium]